MKVDLALVAPTSPVNAFFAPNSFPYNPSTHAWDELYRLAKEHNWGYEEIARSENAFKYSLALAQASSIIYGMHANRIAQMAPYAGLYLNNLQPLNVFSDPNVSSFDVSAAWDEFYKLADQLDWGDAQIARGESAFEAALGQAFESGNFDGMNESWPSQVASSSETKPNGDPLYNYFGRDGFSYNRSAPAWDEFFRLAVELNWGEARVKKEKKAFNHVIFQAFEHTYGTDENDLAAWLKLCHDLGIVPLPLDLNGCRKAVQAIFVNIVDLVDLPYSEEPLRKFASEKELSEREPTKLASFDTSSDIFSTRGRIDLENAVFKDSDGQDFYYSMHNFILCTYTAGVQELGTLKNRLKIKMLLISQSKLCRRVPAISVAFITMMSTNSPSSSLHTVKREPSSQPSELEWLPSTPAASASPPSQRLEAILDALQAPSAPASAPAPTRSQLRLQAIQDALMGVASAPVIPDPLEPVVIQIGGSNRGLNNKSGPVQHNIKPVVTKGVSFLDSFGLGHLVNKEAPAPGLEPGPSRLSLKRPLGFHADGQNLPNALDERIVKKARRVPVPLPTSSKPELRIGGINGRKAADVPVVKKENQSPAPLLELALPKPSKQRAPQLYYANEYNAPDAFFGEHYGFEYDPSQPAWDEFNHLAQCEDWNRKEREDRRASGKGALVQAFNTIYGTDEHSLQSWMTLCQALRITPPPQGLRACREAVEATHVNLVDLVDLPNSEKPIRLFGSEEELSAYTVATRKFFPRNDVEAGSLLQCLLRHILSPGQRRGQQDYW
ncbi:hypothetical protein DXG01_015583 [Tephrocybe rancida]|nr:hypothetical protein DXG01_015583 [Tephrocybe rancida]